MKLVQKLVILFGLVAIGGAAVGSLNLASEARLHVVYTHVTGSDGAGFTLNGVTVEGL